MIRGVASALAMTFGVSGNAICQEAIQTLIVAPGSTIKIDPPGDGIDVEASLDGGLLRPTRELKAPATGDHWLTVASRSRLTGAVTRSWMRVRVDDQAPRLAFTSEPKGASVGKKSWYAPGVKVGASSHDDVAGVAETQFACGENNSAPVVLKTTTACSASSVDRVGNRVEIRETMDVDGQPPSLSLVPEGATRRSGESLFLGAQATIRVTVDDAESGATASKAVTLDGVPSSGGNVIGPFSTGAHSLKVGAEDVVGNKTERELQFTVDAVGPKIDWRIEGPAFKNEAGETLYGTGARLIATATDEGSGVNAFGVQREGSLSPMPAALILDGNGTTLQARDNVGNETTLPISWRLDNEDPTIEVNGQPLDPGSVTNMHLVFGDVLTLAATDRGAGIESLVYSIDQTPFTPAPRQITFLRTGTIPVKLHATDRAGRITRATLNVVVAKKK